MARTVFRLWQSVEEDRPDGYTQRDSCSADYWANHEIIRGRSHDLSAWEPMDLYCYDPRGARATDWDYFGHSGSSGLFSQRAVDALAKYWAPCFDAMPSIFEDHPYYLLHCRNSIDCLDLSASNIKYLPPPDENDIHEIKQFVFHKAVLHDPLIFTVPQQPLSLFATESIPAIVETANLKGIEFCKLDGD